MFCTQCGKQLEAGARFCPSCGTMRESAAAPPFGGVPRQGQLVRSRSQRVIAGVCGGLAEHYGWDLTVVRIVMAVTALFSGVGLVVYVIAWIAIPEGQYALPFSSPMPPPPPPATTGTTAS